MTSNFTNRVRQIVSRIPKGETRTYGEVARIAGRPLAHRAVGNILSKNYDPNVPCHRVIRADGKIGDYNRGGADQKAKLLRLERGLK